MSTLIELTSQIVSAHVSNKQMTSDEMLQELQKVHASLMALETGSPVVIGISEATEAPKITIKRAFKKDEVTCMICGQGFKTLKRHLGQAHDLKPSQYRKQFNIPSTISLTAKSYSESRRQSAIDMGLGENLAKARMARAMKKNAKKAPVPAKKVKPPVPAVRSKAAVPAVKKKATVPAKIQETKVSIETRKPATGMK